MIKNVYTKQKIKKKNGRLKKLTYNCTAFKNCLQTKTIDNGTKFKRRKATAKRETEKDIANPEKNLYHT
jgi:hypothetical protein